MPKKDPSDERPSREPREHARQGRESRERESGEHEEREHGDRGDGPPEGEGREGERPRRRRMGREHAVHQQIVERRLGGGAPATPEAYAKGLEQWKKLPGSVMSPPSDEKAGEESKTPPTGEEDTENRK